jgi:hypothetical protein
MKNLMILILGCVISGVSFSGGSSWIVETSGSLDDNRYGSSIETVTTYSPPTTTYGNEPAGYASSGGFAEDGAAFFDGQTVNDIASPPAGGFNTTTVIEGVDYEHK